jgi:hypothetical protein
LAAITTNYSFNTSVKLASREVSNAGRFYSSIGAGAGEAFVANIALEKGRFVPVVKNPSVGAMYLKFERQGAGTAGGKLYYLLSAEQVKMSVTMKKSLVEQLMRENPRLMARPTLAAVDNKESTGLAGALTNNPLIKLGGNVINDVKRSLGGHWANALNGFRNGDLRLGGRSVITYIRELGNSPLYAFQQTLRTVNGMAWSNKSALIKDRINLRLNAPGDIVRFGFATQINLSTNIRQAAGAKGAAKLTSGEFGVGAGVRTGAEISVTRTKNGSFSVNVELKDAGGGTAAAALKSPVFKTNETDNFSLQSAAFAGTGQMSRGRYQFTNKPDAIRGATLLQQFIKDRNSLKPSDWQFLARARVAHSEGAYVVGNASAGFTLGFSAWPKGADAGQDIKPRVTKISAAIAGQIIVEGRYDLLFVPAKGTEPAKMRVRTETMLQGKDLMQGSVTQRASGEGNPNDGGLPGKRRVEAKVRSGAESEFGSRQAVAEWEYSLKPEDSARIEKRGGITTVEEAASIIADQQAAKIPPNFARMRVTNIQRDGFGQWLNADQYKRNSVSVEIKRPTEQEMSGLEWAGTRAILFGTTTVKEMKSEQALNRATIILVKEKIVRGDPGDRRVDAGGGTADVDSFGLTFVERSSYDTTIEREEEIIK